MMHTAMLTIKHLLLTALLAAIPVGAVVLLGTPELSLPSQWQEVQPNIASGDWPDGRVVDAVCAMAIIAWIASLWILLMSIRDWRDLRRYGYYDEGYAFGDYGGETHGVMQQYGDPSPDFEDFEYESSEYEPSGYESFGSSVESLEPVGASAGSSASSTDEDLSIFAEDIDDDLGHLRDFPRFEDPFTDDFRRQVVTVHEDDDPEAMMGGVEDVGSSLVDITGLEQSRPATEHADSQTESVGAAFEPLQPPTVTVLPDTAAAATAAAFEIAAADSQDPGAASPADTIPSAPAPASAGSAAATLPDTAAAATAAAFEIAAADSATEDVSEQQGIAAAPQQSWLPRPIRVSTPTPGPEAAETSEAADSLHVSEPQTPASAPSDEPSETTFTPTYMSSDPARSGRLPEAAPDLGESAPEAGASVPPGAAGPKVPAPVLAPSHEPQAPGAPRLPERPTSPTYQPPPYKAPTTYQPPIPPSHEPPSTHQPLPTPPYEPPGAYQPPTAPSYQPPSPSPYQAPGAYQPPSPTEPPYQPPYSTPPYQVPASPTTPAWQPPAAPPEASGGPPEASDDTPALVIPVRAYYFTRPGDTLRKLALRFLKAPAQWTDLRALNIASSAVAAAEADSPIPAGTPIALPGDPVPWEAETEPVDAWTLAEETLTAAWGRAPSPQEVVPFWQALTRGGPSELGIAEPAPPAAAPPVVEEPQASPVDTGLTAPPEPAITEPQAETTEPAITEPQAETTEPAITEPETEIITPPEPVIPEAATPPEAVTTEPAVVPHDSVITPEETEPPPELEIPEIATVEPDTTELEPASYITQAEPEPLTPEEATVAPTDSYAEPEPEAPTETDTTPEPEALTEDQPAPEPEAPTETDTTPEPEALTEYQPAPESEAPDTTDTLSGPVKLVITKPVAGIEITGTPTEAPPDVAAADVMEAPSEPDAPEVFEAPPEPDADDMFEAPSEPDAADVFEAPPEPDVFDERMTPVVSAIPPLPAMERPTTTPTEIEEYPDLVESVSAESVDAEAVRAEALAPAAPHYVPSITGPSSDAVNPEGTIMAKAPRSLAGTAIGDAMMLWQIGRMRRRAARSGGIVDVPDEMEQSLQASARSDSLQLIEAAMRQLRAVTVGQLKPKPQVLAVRVGSYGFEVLLDKPVEAPEGWVLESGGYVLELAQQLSVEELNEAGQGPSLCPTLVPVGDTLEGPLMLNIEQIGCLLVSGPDAAAQRLLNSIVGTLSLSPLAGDNTQVVTVGVELTGVLEATERVRDISFDSPELDQFLSDSSYAHDTAVDVLVIGPGNDLLIRRAEQVASAPDSNLALVAATAALETRWPWRIAVDPNEATAVVNPISCTIVPAQPMSPELASTLGETVHHKATSGGA